MENTCKHAAIPNWFMRIVLGLVFITAGYTKIFVMGPEAFGTAVNLPLVLAWLVPLGELFAGIGIIVGGLIKNIDKKGILTMLSGLIIVIIMLGAIFLVKWAGFEGGFLKGIGGMQVDLGLLALGLYFAMMGNSCEGQCTLCAKK